MQVERDEDLERKFTEELFIFYSNPPREGIHQTDLNFCPLRAYYRKVNAKALVDQKSELIKAIGKAHHEVFEILKNHLKEVEVEWHGVINTIDLYGDAPIEIKTTRATVRTVEQLEEMETYINQLKSYCLATGKNYGWIFVVNIIRGEARAFKVTFTDEELKERGKQFLFRKHLLLKALKDKNPSILASCSPSYEWEFGNCPYRRVTCIKSKQCEELYVKAKGRREEKRNSK